MSDSLDTSARTITPHHSCATSAAVANWLDERLEDLVIRAADFAAGALDATQPAETRALFHRHATSLCAELSAVLTIIAQSGHTKSNPWFLFDRLVAREDRSRMSDPDWSQYIHLLGRQLATNRRGRLDVTIARDRLIRGLHEELRRWVESWGPRRAMVPTPLSEAERNMLLMWLVPLTDCRAPSERWQQLAQRPWNPIAPVETALLSLEGALVSQGYPPRQAVLQLVGGQVLRGDAAKRGWPVAMAAWLFAAGVVARETLDARQIERICKAA